MESLEDETQKQIVARVLADRQRRPERLAQMQERQRLGLKVAQECARILKQEFGAQRVVLFGSLLDHEQMWWGSDIDLAVWGLPEQDIFRAGACIEQGHDFAIDLVEIQRALPHVRKAIEQGIEL